MNPILPLVVAALATSPHSVNVDVDHGNVTLVRGARVAVTTDRHGWLNKAKVTQTTRGGVLTIKADCGVGSVVGCSTDVRVTVPAGVPVKVQTDMGDVRADGLNSPSIDVETHVGDV